MKTNRGQIIIPVMLIVILLTLLIPAIVSWVQSDSRNSVKNLKSSRALEMAEAGIDLGFQQLIVSSTTWNNILHGTIPSGFHFDTTYTDLPLGSYAIRITSGPATEQATIVAVGRDKSTGELRAIKAVYQNTVSQTGLYLVNGSTFSNNVQVEWGPIVAKGPIVSDSAHTFPRMFTNSSLSPFDSNGPIVPNTDNVQWWSYNAALPPAPEIDIKTYKATAQALGGMYYNTGLPSYSIALPLLAGTYYFDNDTTLILGVGSSIAQSDIIVRGNLTINFASGLGITNATLPPTTWQEYGNAWSHYQTFDSGAPANFPGQNGTYTSPPNSVPLLDVAIHGFVYVKNQLVINSFPLGQVNFLGAMYIGQASALNSTTPGVTLYFDPAVAATIKTINVTLNRNSWKDLLGCVWTGAHPTCPN